MGEFNHSSLGLMQVKTIEGFTYIDFFQIIRCEADCKHTLIYCKDQPGAIRSVSSLSAIEAQLPDDFFFKCHRSQIINLRHLQKFAKFDRIIHLNDNQSATISEDRIGEFLKRTANPFYGKR